VCVGVGNITSDEPVTVECYRGDVEDRRRATEHVRRRPEVAQYAAETPLTADHLLQRTVTDVLTTARTVKLQRHTACEMFSGI